MKKVLVGLAAGILLLTVSVGEARAQVAWDSPLFVAPASPAGWGIYLVDASYGGIGVMTTWRGSDGPGGLGFRIGLAEGRGDDLAVYGGMDLSGYLLRASNDVPVNVAWVGGAGLGIGNAALLSFPFGVSVGRDFQADGVWFNPYVTPRVVLDAWMGSNRPPRRRDSSLELGLSVDLGMDLSFDPGWAIRFAGTLGDRSALGIGVSFRVF
jgi:hypothetical protein